jgi:hypothetical protein
MASPPEAPARFTPLQTASPGRRLLALGVGPLLWVAAIVVVGLVADRSDAIAYGLAATLIAFVLSILASAVARLLRVRQERKAEQS